MNDEDLKTILRHKDRTIERQKRIIEDLKEVIEIMEDKLALLELENTIIRSEQLYNEKGKVCENQLTLDL